jgi:RNA polymerase primary sigma factor
MATNEAENRGFSHPLEADLLRITSSDSPLDELKKIAKSRPYHTLTLGEQERLLVEVRLGNHDAESTLVRHSLSSVNSAVQRFRDMGVADDELLEESLDSVRKTIKAFSQKEYDPPRYIRQRVINGNIDALTVSIAAHYNVHKADFDLIKGYFKARKSFKKEVGRAPETDELNMLLSMIAEDDPGLLPKREGGGPDRPYFKKLNALSQIHNIFTAENQDYNGHETHPDDTDPEKILQFRNMTEDVQEALKVLSPREMTVLDKRYALRGGDIHTLEETARLMGIDISQVRQIEERAMSRLRNPGIRRKLRDHLEI